MNSMKRLFVPVGLVALIALAFPVSSALAQETPCEARVKALEEQLRQSDNRSSSLARENESLRQQLIQFQTGKPDDTTSANDAALPDPLASPIALFDALVKDYNEKLGRMPRDSKPELAAYHAAVREWTRAASDNFRGPVEWEVQVEKVDSGVKGNAITFYVLDPTGKPIRKSFTKPISARLANEVPRNNGTMTLKGTVTARPNHDSGRAEEGNPESPLFIGPFAEFDFDLEVASLK